MEVFKTLLLIISTASLACCYCPPNKMRSIGFCAYRFHCIGNIRGIRLPNICQHTSNPVTLDVTLSEAIERFDPNLDIELLGYITSLRIYGKWKETELSILQHTTRLKHLYLVNNAIEKISVPFPFYYLSELETVDLSHNKLTEIKELFQFEVHPNILKKLSLAYNAIDELPGYVFEELSSLIELDLSHNLIADLTEEPFYNLTSLQVLKLNNNKIKDLNGAVNNLLNLKHLYLRGNQIENIDEESLKIIIHLETFDVSWNHLEEIKPVMFSRRWDHFDNHSVCKIVLAENHIANVPNDTASRLARHLGGNAIDILTELDLSRNAITNIEYNAFHSLVQLMSLDLSRNQIIHFLVNAEDLACMKYLNLSGNHINHLYLESFSSMNNLQNLDLSYNDLDYIPDMTFNNNYNLRLVNITFNDFEKLDNIRITMFHPVGGVLDLSNNGLYKLKIPYGEGIRLVTLMLHSNNISDASLIELNYQNDLKMLDLGKNLITELNYSSLNLPISVVFLDLTFNCIQKIGPSTFKNLSHLKSLRLGHNALSEIEYGIFEGLSGLENLDLSFNKIHYLDSKLLMDLKSLQFLSLRSNGMYSLDYKYWYGHKVDLKVYIDNNNFSCDWLSAALNNHNNGYSKMRPTVLVPTTSVHSLEGIPCEVESGPQPLIKPNHIMVDERLLVTSQKILEAVREQNYFFRKLMQRYIEMSFKTEA